MSSPDPDIAALRAELAGLRARVARMEDALEKAGRALLGGAVQQQQQQQQQQMPVPRMREAEQSQQSEPPSASIEPSEPWGLKPPGRP
jgi:hypothetical protein